jgi:DNA-binding MarR family transcriptional regulator
MGARPALTTSEHAPRCDDDDARALREIVSTLLRVFLVNERRFPVAGGDGVRYSAHDFQTLGFLARHPGSRMADLCAFLSVAPTTATSVVDRLARRGLVARRASAEDGRARALTLTADGAAMFARIYGQDLVNMRAMLDALPLAERGRFLDMMKRIAAALGGQDGGAG